MAPILSLIIILTLSILITRIASIAIMQTGLSKQASRFQARSAFTGEYQISELSVSKNDWIANKTITEASLRQEGINVLGIERQDGNYLGVPEGKTKIKTGDNIIIYGRET